MIKITKENKLVAVIGLAFFFAVLIVFWAKEESVSYRPLIQDMRLVDSIKIADILDKERIQYYADIKNHMLYVAQEQSEKARLSLAKMGYVIEYPFVTKRENLNQAYDKILANHQAEKESAPIYEQFWFINITKLIMGALIIMIVVIFIIRPALAALILEDDTPNNNDKS